MQISHVAKQHIQYDETSTVELMLKPLTKQQK